MVSKQCLECTKFISKTCKGKPDGKKVVTYFGTKKSGRKSGLNFCQNYEFDYRLYKFNNAAKHTTVTEMKQKAAKQVKKEAEQDFSDIADFAAGLNSSDFADLL